MTTMTVKEALRRGQAALAEHDSPDVSPHHEAAGLLGQAAGLTPEEIVRHGDRSLTKDQERHFLSFLDRRSNHEPLAHITGTARCFDREFVVTPATLIPRPATETLIETVVADRDPEDPAGVYDIGTGSGVIAVTVAARLPRTTVRASDISLEALKVAEDNVARFGLRHRVELRHGSLLGPFLLSLDHREPVILVANLPYLPSAEIDHLPREIRLHEPIAAVDGGPDGLNPYRALLAQTADHLRAPKLDIFLELLPDQHDGLEAIARDHWPPVTATRLLNDAGIQIGIRLSVPGN
jgi:release factor glutamine methyltransferase